MFFLENSLVINCPEIWSVPPFWSISATWPWYCCTVQGRAFEGQDSILENATGQISGQLITNGFSRKNINFYFLCLLSGIITRKIVHWSLGVFFGPKPAK